MSPRVKRYAAHFSSFDPIEFELYFSPGRAGGDGPGRRKHSPGGCCRRSVRSPWRRASLGASLGLKRENADPPQRRPDPPDTIHVSDSPVMLQYAESKHDTDLSGGFVGPRLNFCFGPHVLSWEVLVWFLLQNIGSGRGSLQRVRAPHSWAGAA